MDRVTNSLTKRTQGKQAQLPGKPSGNCHTHLVTSGPSHDKETYRCGRVGPQDDSELIAEDQQGMLPRPSSSGLVTLSGARMVTHRLVVSSLPSSPHSTWNSAGTLDLTRCPAE